MAPGLLPARWPGRHDAIVHFDDAAKFGEKRAGDGGRDGPAGFGVEKLARGPDGLCVPTVQLDEPVTLAGAYRQRALKRGENESPFRRPGDRVLEVRIAGAPSHLDAHLTANVELVCRPGAVHGHAQANASRAGVPA